jgi:hypothetical protein
MIDYPMSLLLIALPWIGGFATSGAPMWIPISAGLAMFVLSTMTAYEAGLLKLVSMRMHLTLDAMLGIFIAGSPWLFGFSDVVWLPFIILGLGELGAACMTQLVPGNRIVQSAHGIPR